MKKFHGTDSAMVSIHDGDALESIRRVCRIDPSVLRRMRNAFFKKRLSADEALLELPKESRAQAAACLRFHVLELHSRHDSRVDGASKLIFRTGRGHLIESVILRISSGRTSLCVSSQVGCAARCGFCATGQMGIAVDLSRDEILDQIVQANQLIRPEGRTIRNVVFMGMGEPLHNQIEVTKALQAILSPHCFGLSPAHLLVSTVGIPEAMVQLATHFPDVGLALSLHSARQCQRERLIPLARRYPLDALRCAMSLAMAVQTRPLMIEYLLLDGVNDTNADLAALVDYLQGMPVHINLIPYNPIDAAPGLSGTPPDRRRAFATALGNAGFKVTVRYSLGADIAAACGQLVQRAQATSGSLVATEQARRLSLQGTERGVGRTKEMQADFGG
jgi:23S rRNA (adenine2503-C2)-methyltransferase